MPPPLLIDLPHGLGVSGVAAWGVRLATSLADRGWRVAIATNADHPEPAHIDPRVRVHNVPPLANLGDDVGPLAPRYREALDELGWSPRDPPILLPNLEAGSYAVAAALTATDADRLRVVGWQHSDTRFDAALMRTYEPMLTRIVGVSRHIATALQRDLPWRAADIVHLPYGVEVRAQTRADDRPPRDPRAPLRIVYTGRIEHEQKRIGVLCALAEELERRRLPHEIELIGDGPASREVDDRLAPLPRARRLSPLPPGPLRERLDAADVFALASRYEGLAVSMLEAMGRGLAPVVTRVDSGASEAIEHERSGLLIQAGRDEPEGEIAARFADAVERLDADRALLLRLQRSALERARAEFSLDAHADRADAMLGAAASDPPRFWPLSRPCAFRASGDGTSAGSVPPDAESRARRALAEIPEDARLAIYGAGRFTRAIAGALADHHVECIADDDPALWGRRLWGLPVVDPRSLPQHEVTDLLIASWMHAQIMTERAESLLGSAVRLHILYAPASSVSGTGGMGKAKCNNAPSAIAPFALPVAELP